MKTMKQEIESIVVTGGQKSESQSVVVQGHSMHFNSPKNSDNHMTTKTAIKNIHKDASSYMMLEN